MIALSYLLSYRPITDRTLEKFEIFNETILVLQVFIVFSFTDANQYKNSLLYDFLFLSLCFTYLLVHLGYITIGLTKTICAKLRKCSNKRQSKKGQQKIKERYEA